MSSGPAGGPLRFLRGLGRRLAGPPAHLRERRSVLSRLERVASAEGPILVGPWLSEVGYELLYWVPFLHWFMDRHGVAARRLMVVSRGGVESWYPEGLGLYRDILELWGPEEFRERNGVRVREAGREKELTVSDLSREIRDRVLREAASGPGVEDAGWLHPSLMYRLFDPFWHGRMDRRFVEKHTIHRLLTPPGRTEAPPGLPDDYVAVKFYFSECFPETSENLEFVERAVRRVSASVPVVMLHTGLQVDNHPECQGRPEGTDILHLDTGARPERNLDVQTEVVRGARMFLGTYGGFAYLAPLLGIPAVSVYSRVDGFMHPHLELARHRFQAPPFGAFHHFAVGELELASRLWGAVDGPPARPPRPSPPAPRTR